MKKIYTFTATTVLLTAAIATTLATTGCTTNVKPFIASVTADTNRSVGGVINAKPKAAHRVKVTHKTTKPINSVTKIESVKNLKTVKTFETEYNKAQKAEMKSPLNDDQINSLVSQGVSKPALKVALKAYQWAVKKGDVTNKRYLTVVDFSQPSTSKRMNVIDLTQGKIVFSELVTQGQGSGSGKMATRFSDVNNSHASVLGAIVTENTYTGKHGYSLRLNGIENINKNVRDRAIVVHSANYATAAYAQANGRLGTSWGCFALSPSVSAKVIQTIKNGSMIYAYAPQMNDNPNYA